MHGTSEWGRGEHPRRGSGFSQVQGGVCRPWGSPTIIAAALPGPAVHSQGLVPRNHSPQASPGFWLLSDLSLCMEARGGGGVLGVWPSLSRGVPWALVSLLGRWWAPALCSCVVWVGAGHWRGGGWLGAELSPRPLCVSEGLGCSCACPPHHLWGKAGRKADQF